MSFWLRNQLHSEMAWLWNHNTFTHLQNIKRKNVKSHCHRYPIKIAATQYVISCQKSDYNSVQWSNSTTSNHCNEKGNKKYSPKTTSPTLRGRIHDSWRWSPKLSIGILVIREVSQLIPIIHETDSLWPKLHFYMMYLPLVTIYDIITF